LILKLVMFCEHLSGRYCMVLVDFALPVMTLDLFFLIELLYNGFIYAASRIYFEFML
jgi:hypothetical protein